MQKFKVSYIRTSLKTLAEYPGYVSFLELSIMPIMRKEIIIQYKSENSIILFTVFFILTNKSLQLPKNSSVFSFLYAALNELTGFLIIPI